jgi:hypothetical protein
VPTAACRIWLGKRPLIWYLPAPPDLCSHACFFTVSPRHGKSTNRFTRKFSASCLRSYVIELAPCCRKFKLALWVTLLYSLRRTMPRGRLRHHRNSLKRYKTVIVVHRTILAQRADHCRALDNSGAERGPRLFPTLVTNRNAARLQPFRIVSCRPRSTTRKELR